jgi:hypothetical protein
MAVWLRLKSGANCLGNAKTRDVDRGPQPTALADVSTAVMGNVRLEVLGVVSVDGRAGKRTPGAAG